MLMVIEHLRLNDNMLVYLELKFTSLIPKYDNLTSFQDFSPISLCNTIYKIVAKVISRWVKSLLSKYILGEQFGFLGWQIHETIGVE